ncbi:GTP-binding protein Rho1 [Serendipita sp. 397]|nr:GTP-binding protein Rho1 [Serendipita sp. 397]
MIYFHCGDFHVYHIPMYQSNYTEEVEVDGKRLELLLQDNPGIEEWNDLRPLTYPNTNVFLLCFSIDQPTSLNNVKAKWLPEILHFSSGIQVPYILVGCRTDLRPSYPTPATLQQTGSNFVTPEDGEAAARSIGALMYLECFARTGSGVSEVYHNAARTALLHPTPKRKEAKEGCIAI